MTDVGPAAMTVVRLDKKGDFAEWRAAARHLLAQHIPPHQVDWRGPDDDMSLFGDQLGAAPIRQEKAEGRAPAISLPRALLDMADHVICHRSADVPARLYRLFWRVQADRYLLGRKTDEDVHWARQMVKNINRDIHKMHAFVRFRHLGVGDDGRENYAAWFEPEHLTLRLGAPFFQRRFSGMNWAIITPDARAIWDGQRLVMGEGGQRDDVPDHDVVEQQWRAYYGAIFNPARVKINAMRSEMPKKYWHNLPEAQDIASLLAGAEQRVAMMQAAEHQTPNKRTEKWQKNVQAALADELGGAGDGLDAPENLEQLGRSLDQCRRCSLHCAATQAVRGEGPVDAALMMVGEQPGDQEDLAGRPFVGPAGQLLTEIMAQNGLTRSDIYMTNAVKHFKFHPRGKLRLHQRPTAGEIDMCRWWLDLERQMVRPKFIMTLGATALRGVLGPKGKLADLRGQAVPLTDGAVLFPTIHPSYLLRLPDQEKAAEESAIFAADLRRAAQHMAAAGIG